MKMEVIEDHSLNTHAEEVLKPNTIENEAAAIVVAADQCQNSNGVAEIEKTGQEEVIVTDTGSEANPEAPTELLQTELPQNSAIPSEPTPDPIETSVQDESPTMDTSDQETNKATVQETKDSDTKDQDIKKTEIEVEITEVIIEDDIVKPISQEGDMIEITVPMLPDPSNNIPKFKTEVIIESNDCTSSDGHESTNIISEFGESIELSEVLRSSDVTTISENNNSAGRQEVFNKEELLDILQGNDVETTSPQVLTEKKHVFKPPHKDIETKLALQQLSRLKREKNYRGIRMTKGRKEKKYRTINKLVHNTEDQETTEKKLSKEVSDESEESENISNNKAESNTESKVSKDSSQTENIVNVLVMDWDDDEQEVNESDQPKEGLLEDSEKLLNETEKYNQGIIAKDDKPSIRSSIDALPGEDQTPKDKSGEENQPQRRLGRVIKKKVIFDPDNPDTFTKTRTKSREPVRESALKDQPPLKKGKQEITPPRSKSKSPNLQWKKPSSKNNKQNRRLTEVDKLFMDEGAVNMIYQLTPEAHKGKKTRETKAEFIKKIQSSTPDVKEMKFRERKTLKYKENEAKKILVGKHRVSLNSSIKSPSVSEDFETHSADDSIIYRRHSSSSYSSSCMSPRRLSDVDSGSAQTNTRSSQITSENQSHDKHSTSNTDQTTDVFMSNSTENSSSDVINKDDYLSMKEKLNSKLSLAINKRKRENNKNEKPSKQKKVTRNEDKIENETKKSLGELKHVTIKIDQRLAEISVESTGLTYNIEILKEIEQALIFVNGIKETSVTLLTECCTLCSNLDLKHLVDEDQSKRAMIAHEVTETIRSLLVTVDKHSKLLCYSVGAECRGVGLALAALSDVVLASERACFALAGAGPAAPLPAAAALTARCRLPHSMVDDLILFGRVLSASEALQGGLVSRVLWPDGFSKQAYSIAKDIASEPAPIVILKKNLLSLKKTGEDEQTFLSSLEAEGEIFVQFWTSVEGQELLRATNI